MLELVWLWRHRAALVRLVRALRPVPRVRPVLAPGTYTLTPGAPGTWQGQSRAPRPECFRGNVYTRNGAEHVSVYVP